jgi:replicative DNA helicase
MFEKIPLKNHVLNGKMQPQATDLEEAVLGGMLIDSKNNDELMEILHTDIFYKEDHKAIFEAIKNLYTKSTAIDLLTISQELRRLGKIEIVGGDIYLIQLTQKISSSAHSEFHAKILQQKYIMRGGIQLASEMIENAYNDTTDSLEFLDAFYSGLNAISEKINVDDKASNFEDDTMAYFDNLKIEYGLPSSIKLMQKYNISYVESDLIILGGRPGSGKTAFALCEMLHLAILKIPVLFFSLEMSKRQIINRLMSIISGVELEKIKTKNLTPEELHKLKNATIILSKLPITIDDRPSLSPLQIAIKSKKLKREKGIKMIYIDYLGLMKIKDRKLSKYDETTEISNSLKGLAKELNVPVMALAQLSRNVESRGGNKRPQLSDLRDSGSIEQDANIVMFMYRPEYYKIETWDDEYQTPTKDEAEIDIAKNRDGQVFAMRVATDLKYMRFIDLELKGQNIDYKYLNQPKPVTYFEPPEITNNLKTIDPKEAFDSDIEF